jgi:hypothetical protein
VQRIAHLEACFVAIVVAIGVVGIGNPESS